MRLRTGILVAACILLPRTLLAAGPYTVTGMGGAGGMYTPSVSPYDADLMLLSCDMGGSYRSLDGGSNWELIHHDQLRGSLRCKPLFLPDAIVWATGSDVRISRDCGATWTTLTPNGFPWSGPVRHLAGTSVDRIFVGTTEGIWHASEVEEAWTEGPKGNCRGILTLGDGTWAVVENAEGFLWRTDGGGTSWREVSDDSSGGTPFSSLTGGSSGDRTILFATAPDTGILRSMDLGISWTLVHEWERQSEVVMARNQTDVAYAAQTASGGRRRQVWRTQDGGEMWERTFRMEGDDPNVERSWVQTEINWGYGISPLGLGASSIDPNIVMVSTQGDFYVSRDGGDSWRPYMNEPLGVLPGDPGKRFRSNGLEVTSSWRYYVDPWDADRRYIAYTDIGFARSVDSGDTWVHSAAGSPWSNTFYEIAFDPNVKGRIYAATSNRHDIPHWTHINSNTDRHSGGVCVSDDSGQTWRVLGEGQPKLPCTSVILDTVRSGEVPVLYATYFEGGLYRSGDGGKTWENRSDGLGRPGNLHALSVQIHPITGDLYCVVTAHRHGTDFPVPGGIWRSTDEGQSWNELTADLDLAWPGHFAIHPSNPDIIYLTGSTAPGKRQGGLYKTVDGGKAWARVLTDSDLVGDGYVHILHVNLHASDPDTLFIGGSADGLWMSPDAGITWKRYGAFPFATPANVTIDPREPSKMFVTTFGGGVWHGPVQP